MAVKPEQVQKLRRLTGVGMMDAKAALDATKGDIDKAVEHLRKSGHAKAAGKAGRATGAGLVEAYVHLGRVGAMVELRCETDFVARTEDFKNFAHELSMQVAAAAPLYLASSDIPSEILAKEQSIYKDDLKGKPKAVADKIMEGKLAKYYEQVCLLEQPTIKDADITVGDSLKNLITKLGENIVISRFSRFELGEGDE